MKTGQENRLGLFRWKKRYLFPLVSLLMTVSLPFIAGCSGSTASTGGNTNGKGKITDFSIPTANSNPQGITAADGNLWFTESNGNQIGSITTVNSTPLLTTTDGSIKEYSDGLTSDSFPTGITPGPDGNLWFTESYGNKIGMVALH